MSTWPAKDAVAGVAEPERDRGGEVAAGALTGDRDDCGDTPSRSAFANAQRVTSSQSSSPAGYGSSGASRYPTETTTAPEPCASSRATLSISPMLPRT